MRVHTDIRRLPDFQHTVVTIGSFDGVHTGHRRIIERVISLARKQGTASVVITFDPHPRTVLGQAGAGFGLLTTAAEKTALLERTGIDHLVIVPFDAAFAAQSAQEYVEAFLIEHFHPHTVVIGYDHRFGADRRGDIAFLQQYAASGAFQVVEIPPQEVDDITVSSSKIRRAVEQADFRTANHLAGSYYLITGKVVRGNQIGATIGFPTANMEVEAPYKLIPPEGIYAAFVTTPAGRYSGMLYIGKRPTIDGNGERRIEVNILDFEGDLYEKEIQAEVVDFIRSDKKLDGLEALQQQINEDKKAIVARLEQEKKPEVAIVILNYNTRKHLEQYLPSVVAHSAGARIVVADNGSPDDSLDFLRQHYPDIELLDLKQNYGFAEGYNQALRQVKADYYVILNSDVEVTSGWLWPIIECMEAQPDIAIAQPKILAEQRRSRFEHAGASGGWIDLLGYPFCRGRMFTHVEEDTGQYDDAAPCFWAAGAAFFIRGELYHNFGGFDGDFFAHNEEIDLCWRVKRAGYSVWCFPQSVVYHLGGGTLGYESPRKAFLNFRNSLFSLIKNDTPVRLWWVLPSRLLLDGVAAGMYLFKRQPAMIKAVWDAHISFYKYFGRTLRKRRETASLVEKYRRHHDSTAQEGRYNGSVVFAHYIRRIKEFYKLKS